MIGDVAQSRWTLRFRDRALERAYRDDLAAQLRTQVKWVLVVMVIAWFSAAAFDERVAGSPANADFMLILRLAVGGPALLIATALYAWLPERAFLRWNQIVVLIGTISLTATWALAALFLPDPHLAPLGAAVQAWILGTFALALLYGLDFAVSFVVVIVIYGFVGVVAADRFPQATSSDVFNTLLGLAIAYLGAYLLERTRRQRFLAQRAADRLLENVLPVPIAARLKDGERRIAEQFDAATVLFADLVGFTKLAERLPPAELVDTLDAVFSAFDDLAERHGLEKIKTMGDAYMVVGGVPTTRPDHAEAVARMALAMREVVADKDGLQIRIGIHTGPVVAGVIGKRKFVYDLWGDTVNLASRMESHGVIGGIQVSAATAAALDGAFTLEPRGAIAIKGKSEEQEAFLLTATRCSDPARSPRAP